MDESFLSFQNECYDIMLNIWFSSWISSFAATYLGINLEYKWSYTALVKCLTTRKVDLFRCKYSIEFFNDTLCWNLKMNKGLNTKDSHG